MIATRVAKVTSLSLCLAFLSIFRHQTLRHPSSRRRWEDECSGKAFLDAEEAYFLMGSESRKENEKCEEGKENNSLIKSKWLLI